MKPEEEKFRGLVNELKRRKQHVLAKAVESAIGYCLENGVLYLQYAQPTLTSISARMLLDSQWKLTLDAAAMQIGVKVQVL
jgi:hypothetical protein